MGKSITKNIVKEIMRECYRKRITPQKEFVMFLLELYLLDPNWSITEYGLIVRPNVQKLVAYVVDKLEDRKSIAMKTLKMQFYFLWNMNSYNNLNSKMRQKIFTKLQPILVKIWNTKSLTNQDEMEWLKKMIVFYIILLSDCGNPTVPEVFLEGLYALQSIISDDELKQFCTYTNHKKSIILENLSKTVCGIRLFNKYCGKGGESIPDLQYAFKTKLVVVENCCQFALEEVKKKVEKLTHFFNKYYTVIAHDENVYSLESVFPNKRSDTQIENCKDTLIHSRQYETYINELIVKLDKLDEENLKTAQEMTALFKDIDDKVTNQFFLPVDFICPFFNNLSDCWTQLQGQVRLLYKYTAILNNLEAKAIVPLQYMVIEYVVRQSKSKSIETCMEDACFRPSNDTDSLKLNVDVEYLGYCCWKLVESNGVLIPGQSALGLAFYQGKNFNFSCFEAIASFEKRPEHYMMALLDLARKKPTLINFLRLHDQLLAVQHRKELVKQLKIVRSTATRAVQVEVMHTPPNIDQEYLWNLWEHKRKFMKLAVLKNNKTLATNTVKTFNRNSMETQTLLTKNKATQSVKDKGVSTSNVLCVGGNENHTSILWTIRNKNLYSEVKP